MNLRNLFAAALAPIIFCGCDSFLNCRKDNSDRATITVTNVLKEALVEITATNPAPPIAITVNIPSWPKFTNEATPLSVDTNETKTISDFLADQVLYNLALYKDFEDGKRMNGLPSFITLAPGKSLSAAPQSFLTTKIDWTFVPVIDGAQLSRLSCLYRAEFEMINSNELASVFPSEAADAAGHPMLSYIPKTGEDGDIELDTAGKPIFLVKIKERPAIGDIPGAVFDENGTVTNGWFTFTPPTNSIPAPSIEALEASRFGPYLNHYIWITNRENFLKFSLLVWADAISPSVGHINASP